MSKIITVLRDAWRVRPQLLANALFHGVKRKYHGTSFALGISKLDTAVVCFFGAIKFTRTWEVITDGICGAHNELALLPARIAVESPKMYRALRAWTLLST